jgi:hypothetical protein
MAKPKLYDVVIYEKATRKVASVIGRDMRLCEGFYNATKRRETALGRINDNYGAAIVEAGKYDEGDVLGKNESQ